MSKNIDWTQPVTGEEREWAKQFPGLHGGLIEQTDAEYGAPEEPTLAGQPDEDDDAEAEGYADWTVAELQQEIRNRNKKNGSTMAVSGQKPELIARLEEDDAAEA
jgi:hypothetical protein